MVPQTKNRSKKWITRYDKEAERSFFFYATIFMAIMGIIVHFFGS